jgi:serine/threonine protein phosphatase 1
MGAHLFVHAGLRPGIPLSGQLPEDLLWIRDEFIDSDWDFGKTVVFGHTPFRKPLFQRNKIGIDTGMVYGGRLTCIELPSRTVIQV